jgi:hypothetical protein
MGGSPSTLLQEKKDLTHKSVDEALGLIGLLMISYAVFSFDKTVPFPSLYALIPTIGAGLIILFTSPNTMVGRMLGTKLLVGIGLISYSAYLWHQPILAFTRHRSLKEPSELLLSALVVLSFLLAYLSWRYVEMPFRKRGVLSRKATFTLAIICSLVFIAIGLSGHITNGFIDRSINDGQTLKSIEEKLKVNHGLSDTCVESFTLSSDCRTSEEPLILIWGDSFAMHLVQGILASNPDARIIQMTKSVCGPFFDVAPVVPPEYPVSWARGCLEFSGKVREWLKANKSVKYAVVSSPFSQYLSKDNSLLFRSGELIAADSDLAAKEFERTLVELELMRITPVVFSPPPSQDFDIGQCLARVETLELNLDNCNFRLNEQPNSVDSFLDIISKKYRIVHLDNIICYSSLCKTHDGSTYIYRDKHHLSHGGSAYLGKKNNFYRMIVGTTAN